MYNEIENTLTSAFKAKYMSEEIDIVNKYVYKYGLSKLNTHCFNEIKHMYKNHLIDLGINKYIIIAKNKLDFKFRKNISNKSKELIIGILRINNIL